MLTLHRLSLSKSLITTVANVLVSPLDFALASLVWLSFVRSADVSTSVSHSTNLDELLSFKTVIACSSEFVRFVCFCSSCSM